MINLNRVTAVQDVEEKDGGPARVFEEIMAWNSPKLVKETNLQISKTQKG